MGHVVGSDGPGVWPKLDELVTAVVEKRAAIAALQAAEAALLADAVDLVLVRTEERRAQGRRIGDDLPLREVCAELAAAMRLSDRTVQGRLGDATTLVTSFAATHRAWQEGRVDAAHVSAILDAGAAIADDDARARYELRVLDAARHETPGRLRPLAHVIAARVDPDSVDERHRVANSRRAVRVIDLDDSMARLLADLPATLAYAIFDRLTQSAHHLKDREEPAAGAVEGRPIEVADDADMSDAGGEAASAVVVTGPSRPRVTTTGSSADASVADEAGCTDQPHDVDLQPMADARSMDELRADILADLLLTGAPMAHGDKDAMGSIAGRVQITIPVLTVAGVGNEPAILAGHGPIDSETARRLAAGAPGWDRVMTHPHTGAPLAVDRYRPSNALRRFLGVRDEHCRTPGCRMPVWRCDIDHTIDAALGGATCECNLAHFCRRHHTLKHASDWKVRQLGAGVLEWISPTGRRYLDRPPMIVTFVPHPAFRAGVDGDPPPF